MHIYKAKKYTIDNLIAFATAFLNGGTDFETPLIQAIALVENEGFENADIVFITDGECAVSGEFASVFRDKGKQLKFTVTGIVIDTDEPGMTFSLASFCEKVYRLSEITGDNVVANIIKCRS